MPPNHLETRMDAGDAAVSHAPKSPTRRGISDAALRAAEPTSKPYKLFAGNGLYLEHMLSHAMVGNGLYESGRFVLLYPKQNHHCESAASFYNESASVLTLLYQVSRW